MEKVQKLESMEQLLADPGRYGFCTFDDFRKNPAKWKPDPLQSFTSVEQAGTLFKKNIKKMKYEIEGYACDTLEAVQMTARQMGYREKDLEYRILIDPLGGGKVNMVVKFFHKSTFEKRGKW